MKYEVSEREATILLMELKAIDYVEKHGQCPYCRVQIDMQGEFSAMEHLDECGDNPATLRRANKELQSRLAELEKAVATVVNIWQSDTYDIRQKMNEAIADLALAKSSAGANE